ncbi:hypothetical protein [Marinovum sp.]|uniref:hypothetical protein n=1 Tax=Marinovum sp. TaxID=2024839 RepID=UPI003A8D0B0A
MTGPVAVRTAPHAGAPVLLRLPAGAVIEVLHPGAPGGWSEIRGQAGTRQYHGHVPAGRIAPAATTTPLPEDPQ